MQSCFKKTKKIVMPLLQTVFHNRALVSDKRLEICKTCPHYNLDWGRCEKCGCIMKFKTIIMNSECPIGKWKSEEDYKKED